MRGLRQPADEHARRHRKGDLRDQLAPAGTHGRGADHPAAAEVPGQGLGPDDQLHEALRAPGGDAPVDVGHRQLDDPGPRDPLGGLRLGQSHPTHLRVGEGDPGNGSVLEPGPGPAGKGAGPDQAAHHVGGVGERELSRHVARCPHALGCRPEPGVRDHGSPVIDGDACPLQAEALGHRPPPDGDQQVARGDGAAVREGQAHPVGHGVDPLHPGAGPDGDAVRFQGRLDDPRRLRLLLGEHAVATLDHRHLAAEPPERLGQLAADRTTPQHRQVPRQVRGPEDGLVGQVRDARQPLDARHDRSAAGCQDDPSGTQNCPLDVDGQRTGQDRPGPPYLDARGPQDLLVLRRGDPLDRGGDLCDRLRIRRPGCRSRDQRLAGYAAVEGAVAAGPALRDEQDAVTRPSGGPGRSHPRGAGTDDEQVRVSHAAP